MTLAAGSPASHDYLDTAVRPPHMSPSIFLRDASLSTARDKSLGSHIP